MSFLSCVIRIGIMPENKEVPHIYALYFSIISNLILYIV
nr:MAG TPA: hypothetical protein [Caudoviricetes sp.]